MDKLTSLLTASGFTRTDLPLEQPIVIHACAGAGKSTLIRNFLAKERNSYAATFGLPDKPTLDGLFIRSACAPVPSWAEFKILDEYLSGNTTVQYQALFCDPLQVTRDAARPHFVCTLSKRFGYQTAKLLTRFQIPCSAIKPDQVLVHNIFEKDPIGTLIAWEPEVCELLSKHQLTFQRPDEVLGATFKSVTVLAESLSNPSHKPSDLYVALTRHTDTLQLLLADDDEIRVIKGYLNAADSST